MSQIDNEIYSLPISGHYDCGYSYGIAGRHELPAPAPVLSQSQPRIRDPKYGTIAERRPSYFNTARPRSPPTVLPLSFTRAPVSTGTYPVSEESASSPSRQDSIVESPLSVSAFPLPKYTRDDVPPQVPPKSPARLQPITLRTDLQSNTSLNISTQHSRQASAQSFDKPIEPDQLPAHSNPQFLSPTQSEAFSGPRPVQPVRLGRREVSESHSGATVFQLSDETKLKLSRQAIYQVYEAGSSSIIGTLGYAIDAADDIAAILRGQDVMLKRESASSNRWLFRPSSLTKKGAYWYWHKDKLRGDVVLSDARKHGTVIAKIQRDVLSFERAGLDSDTVNEITFSAMALAELARRSVLYEDAPNLAAAIAVVAFGEAATHSDEDAEHIVKPKRKLTLNLRS